jgi:hypothetical protein
MACEETLEGKNHYVDLVVSRECFVQFITLFYRQWEWGMLSKLTFLIGGNSCGSHHFRNSSHKMVKSTWISHNKRMGVRKKVLQWVSLAPHIDSL